MMLLQNGENNRAEAINLLKKIKNEVKRTLKQVEHVVKSVEKKEEQSIVNTKDNAIEISEKKVIHSDIQFIADNPNHFLKLLDENGIITEHSQLLSKVVFESFLQRFIDTVIWLPNKGHAFIQVIHLRSHLLQDGKVKVVAVVITSSAMVKCERNIEHRHLTRHLGNNQERKWTSTETRQLTAPETQFVYNELIKEMSKYQDLHLAKINSRVVETLGSSEQEVTVSG